jgi:hypothetical protein
LNDFDKETSRLSPVLRVAALILIGALRMRTSILRARRKSPLWGTASPKPWSATAACSRSRSRLIIRRSERSPTT